MSEKQPTSYVICRARLLGAYTGKKAERGMRIPVKVFDTRREATAYAKLMNSRSKLCRYTIHRVKQG